MLSNIICLPGSKPCVLLLAGLCLHIFADGRRCPASPRRRLAPRRRDSQRDIPIHPADPGHREEGRGGRGAPRVPVPRRGRRPDLDRAHAGPDARHGPEAPDARDRLLGGGQGHRSGIGLRMSHDADSLAGDYETVRRLAASNFGDAGVFLEHFVQRARHIEVQILGLERREGARRYCRREGLLSPEAQTKGRRAAVRHQRKQRRDGLLQAEAGCLHGSLKVRSKGSLAINAAVQEMQDALLGPTMSQPPHPASRPTTISLPPYSAPGGDQEP